MVQAVVCGREAHLVKISNFGEGPGCSELPPTPNTMASRQEWQEVAALEMSSQSGGGAVMVGAKAGCRPGEDPTE